jgi:hypothetical protein
MELMRIAATVVEVILEIIGVLGDLMSVVRLGSKKCRDN